MEIISPIVAIRIIFLLGITNLVLFLLIFFSCRCLPMSTRIGKRLMNYVWYQHFYKFHCYLWYIFGISIVIHAILGIIVMGVPF